MLSQRYACPFLMLDEFIQLGQLHDFVTEVMKSIVEERDEKIKWEFFLHKVFDKTYEEFLNGVPEEKETSKGMSEEEIKNVVNESASLIDLF